MLTPKKYICLKKLLRQQHDHARLMQFEVLKAANLALDYGCCRYEQ